MTIYLLKVFTLNAIISRQNHFHTENKEEKTYTHGLHRHTYEETIRIQCYLYRNRIGFHRYYYQLLVLLHVLGSKSFSIRCMCVCVRDPLYFTRPDNRFIRAQNARGPRSILIYGRFFLGFVFNCRLFLWSEKKKQNKRPPEYDEKNLQKLFPSIPLMGFNVLVSANGNTTRKHLHGTL